MILPSYYYLVVTVAKSTEYIHSLVSMPLACTFVGKETPDSVTWTSEASTLVNGQGDYVISGVLNKQGTLTKSSTDGFSDASYTCTFTMGDGDTVANSINVVSARKCEYTHYTDSISSNGN